MDLGLTGKIAVVTGASRGIGRATALALAAEGCRVVLCARGQVGLDDAAAALRAHCGRADAALPLAADLTAPDGVAALLSAVAALGGADVLVNNLGGSGARSWAGADEADLASALDRNLWPAFRLSRALAPAMAARGGGAIVIVSSIWGREAGGAPNYNVAKAAEISLAKAMARELAPQRIRVNSVAPGSVWFPGGGWDRRQQADPEGIAAFAARELPFGRFGRPEEIADVIAFLASPRAAWIAGACITVDGCQSRAF